MSIKSFRLVAVKRTHMFANGLEQISDGDDFDAFGIFALREEDFQQAKNCEISHTYAAHIAHMFIHKRGKDVALDKEEIESLLNGFRTPQGLTFDEYADDTIKTEGMILDDPKFFSQPYQIFVDDEYLKGVRNPARFVFEKAIHSATQKREPIEIIDRPGAWSEWQRAQALSPIQSMPLFADLEPAM